MLQVMFDKGVDINIIDFLGNILFIDVLDFYLYDYVFFLFECGVDFEIKVDNGWMMGNQLQCFFDRVKVGSDEYKKFNEIKDVFI